MVKVSFNIKGTAYVDKKDGMTKYITNLDAWRVENANAAAPAAPSQPAPAYSGNSNTNFNTSASSSASSEAVDDLPF
jgi:hypothetical protein